MKTITINVNNKEAEKLFALIAQLIEKSRIRASISIDKDAW